MSITAPVPRPAATRLDTAGLLVLLAATFLSTIATFGTALDVTVAELAIESFFPAGARTRERLLGRATVRA